ncbi:right-handed parallel beta-helix repeat-containing protein [Natrinema halophilum]|uniref:Right-handed parallel beta-helix repeat-containing protein n=1 Tax=Natrinema halophilum TaxID=1699371 RepID=A0A7D5GKE6_9EURY|nr:right-handed parallel beta-helix repeat-containing protein [Natrinema halophilum]QLG48572.1 right-handed parallel beta-helix repeat-containing protein [Natrinema halophilum]
MARDEPVRDRDSPAETTVSDDERDVHGVIDRRSYLKLAGATAITAGVGASAASAAGGEYDVIEARGQTIRIDSGETWENKLIDFGDRNDILIVAKGTNWTIRNVGFTGTIPYNETIFGVCDSGSGTSVMENIYFGESTGEQPASERSICIWVDPDHSGHLDVKRVTFNVPGNNGIYGSAPAYNGNGGSIALDSCYGNDCHHTAFRIGDCGMSIENCMSYKSGTRAANRNAWVWEGDYGGGATIRNSHFITNGTGGSVVTYGNPNLTIDNVHTDDGRGDGSNPRHFVPEGCPESGEEAARGGSDDGSSSPPADDEDGQSDELPSNTLTVTGTGEPTEYYVETTDELVDDPNAGPLETYDAIDGTSATGWVTTSSHVDQFRFAGDLHEVAFRQGSARVEVNGEVIDPAEYNGDQSSLANTLLVDGVGTSGGSRYEFTVSGTAEKATVKGATIDDEDSIESGHVTGSVAGWRDGFRFDGELEELTIDGDARIYVNGEQVDPADYGDEQPHVLTLVGNGSSANYEITVDGTIDTVAGDDSEEYATVMSGNTVEGSIERGAQRFRFSGALTDVTFLDGSAHVYLDDQRIDPDQYGEQVLLPHAIVVDGTDTDGETSYSFTVDGEVITSSYRDASIDPSDEIDGNSITGRIDDEIDAYWFDGDIADFHLRGDAAVDVQYNVRSD